MKGNRLTVEKDLQYYKFCIYGLLKNLRLFEPFLILFFLENNLSFLQIGFLYSLREILRNIFEIPGGIISDSIGRKKTMITSFVFYIFSFLTFYYSSSYVGFGAAMALYALGDAFRTGTHKAMIFDYLKIKGREHQKVHYYGYTRSYSQIGSAISALVAGSVVFFSGNFRIVFLFSVIPYMLDLLLIASYPKALDGVQVKFYYKQFFIQLKFVITSLIQTFRSLKMLKALSSISVYTGYYKAMKDYLQPILKTLALSLPFLTIYNEEQRTSLIVGISFFLIYLITSRSSRNAGRFADKFKHITTPLNLTIITGLIAGVLSGILYAGNLYILTVLSFAGIYIIENIRKPIGISYIAEGIDKKVMASVLSVESQLNTLVAIILAPLIGYMADIFGIQYSLVIISGSIILLSPLYLLKSKNPDIK